MTDVLTDADVESLRGKLPEVDRQTRADLAELMQDLDSAGLRSALDSGTTHLDRAGRSLGSALLLIEDIARVLGARRMTDVAWDDLPVLHRAISTAYSLAHDAEKRLADHLRELSRACTCSTSFIHNPVARATRSNQHFPSCPMHVGVCCGTK